MSKSGCERVNEGVCGLKTMQITDFKEIKLFLTRKDLVRKDGTGVR
jgi:hypothetical protein